MDFTYDDEQNALRDAVRGLIGKAYSDYETRRQTTKEDPGFDEKVWTQLAEMGLLGLPFSEDDGGVGAGPVEIGIVCQELGRVIAPEPYLGSVVLAGGLVSAVGTPEQRQEILGALSAGESVLAFAHAEPGSRWSDSATAVTATQDGDGWTITGTKDGVLHGARADVLIVSAALPDGGTGLFVVPGDSPRARGLLDVRRGPRGAHHLRRHRRHPAGRGGCRRHDEHRDRPRHHPDHGGQPVARRDADAAQGDHGVPQEPQAVRRHAQHLPGAHLPRRRHVHLPGAHPQPRRLGDDGRRSRSTRPRSPTRRRASASRSAGAGATSARRRSSCTAGSG